MVKALYSLLVAGSLGLVGCNDPFSSSENPITAGDDCTLTQGYWKNHGSAWPVDSVELGSVTYTKAQALQILDTPVAGNGLVALAHQLISTKLNVASGSTNAVAATVTQADALIGALIVPPVGTGSLTSSQTSALTHALDDYNMGTTGPGHCEGTPCDPHQPPPPGEDGSGSGSGSDGSDDGNLY